MGSMYDLSGFGIDVVDVLDSSSQAILDYEKCHAQLGSYLGSVYGIEPHSSLVLLPSAHSRKVRRELMQSRVQKDYGTSGLKLTLAVLVHDFSRFSRPFRHSDIIASTYYTDDLDIPISPKPAYIIIYHENVNPFQFFLTLSGEITHGEHMSHHISSTVENHKGYNKRFSQIHQEAVAHSIDAFLASKFGLQDHLPRLPNTEKMQFMGYKFARFASKLDQLTEEEAILELSRAFKTTDDLVMQAAVEELRRRGIEL